MNDNVTRAIKELLIRQLKVLVNFVFHLFLIVLLTLGLYGVESLMNLLWSSDLLLFGQVPVRYLFSLLNLVLVIVFGANAIFTSYGILRGDGQTEQER